MNFFDGNFYFIRNNHIIPKVHYGIKTNKVDHWNIRDVLTTKLITLNKLSGNNLEIEISQSDYYKSIFCEIELFYTKLLIHYRDFKNLKNISMSWKYVTLYYLSFFSLTLLYRFLDCGFIYLTKADTKKLNDFSIVTQSQAINLPTGNYYFNLKGINEYGNLILDLSSKDKSVHIASWEHFDYILNQFYINSTNEEKLIINKFLDLFKFNDVQFPSTMRNNLNYRGISSFFDLKNEIDECQVLPLDQLFLEKLLKLKKVDSLNHKIEIFNFIASYLFNLNIYLYSELSLRNDFCKSFQKVRKKSLADLNNI